MSDLLVNLDEASSASDTSDLSDEDETLNLKSPTRKNRNKKKKDNEKGKQKLLSQKRTQLADGFEFEDSNVSADVSAAISSGNWDFLSETSGVKSDVRVNPHRSARTNNLDAKVEAMRKRILSKGEVELSDDEGDISESELVGHQAEPSELASGSGDLSAAAGKTNRKGESGKHVSDDLFAQRAEIQDFFTDNLDIKSRDMATNFVQLKLSRPLQRGVQALKYERPTPIQASVIPLALEGRDICASAQTGSGKTAAFLLPTLERLLFRGAAATRVAIITPTRELATQIHSMSTALAQFTDIRITLVVGGLSLAVQAAELRATPDIVVCTPGRMIDHLRNSLGVHFDGVEILILDEADRLLGMGFTEEVHELVRYCPKQKGSRQTMLFSATMTAGVEELIKLSLHRPIRVSVNTVGNVADHLIQEFVRIRPKYEDNREAIVLALCKRSLRPLTEYAKQRGQGGIIVFCNRKKHAHRLVLLFGLFGLKAAELHGNLTQRQRAEAMTRFKRGDVNFLVATDLAARGLDVEGVLAVINLSMPKDHRTYIHRVGRTARAGRSGRSITLVGEKGRHVLRAIMKSNEESLKANKEGGSVADVSRKAVMKSRQVPADVIERWQQRIEAVQQDLSAIMKDESLEKRLQQAEMEANRAANLVIHADEIKSRPKRTWFQSEKEKQKVAEAQTSMATSRYHSLKATRPTSQRKRHTSEYDGDDSNDGSGTKSEGQTRRSRSGKHAHRQGNIGKDSKSGGVRKKQRWENARNGRLGKQRRAALKNVS